MEYTRLSCVEAIQIIQIVAAVSDILLSHLNLCQTQKITSRPAVYMLMHAYSTNMDIYVHFKIFVIGGAHIFSLEVSF